jgi:SOS-response transcriptional repressor LexA
MVRAARKSLKMTLDDLQARSRISKPYLSQIETGHAPPPDDAKILKLERQLGFPPGHLLRAAHLERTPMDIRVYIEHLLADNRKLREQQLMARQVSRFGEAGRRQATADAADSRDEGSLAALGRLIPLIGRKHWLRGDVLRAEALDFPAGAAEDYVRCPGIDDPAAFAVRVRGHSMADLYREGDLLIFSAADVLEVGSDYLLRLADGTCVFRRAYDDGPAGMRLQPLNPAYPPMCVSRQQIVAMYRTLATIRRSAPAKGG